MTSTTDTNLCLGCGKPTAGQLACGGCGVATSPPPLEGVARRRAIERIAALAQPGRRREFVIYVAGYQPPDFDLNLEVDDAGVREAPDEADHWFVIDAAMAQERDPAWSEYFDPIPEERVREAVISSLAWSEERPGLEFARLNAARARHYLEHGEWISKEGR